MNTKILLSLILLLFGVCTYPFAQNRYLLVTKKTTLRVEPHSRAKKVVRLSENDKLLFLGNCERYYCKVSFYGRIGWVKKRCFREIYPKGFEKVAPENNKELVIEKDSDAWEDLPITKNKKVDKESPLEDVFQRLREVSSEDVEGVLVKEYGEENEINLERLEKRTEAFDYQKDNDFNSGGKESGEVRMFYFICLVVFGIFIRNSLLFKKSVPDWEKSISYKTVDKSGTEVGAIIKALFWVIFIAILFFFFGQNFIFN